MKIDPHARQAWLAIAAVAFALLACQSKINQKKLDKIITKMFDKQLSLEVSEIDCPEDVKIKEGETFECEVTVEPSGTIPVVVEMTDDDGSVDVKTKYDVITPKKAAEVIVQGLASKGVSAKVDCGKKVRLEKPKSKFTCQATDSQGLTKPVAVTIDEDGKTRWAIE